MLRKCPGIDRLRADVRDKLKTYLQSQVIRNRQYTVWFSYHIVQYF